MAQITTTSGQVITSQQALAYAASVGNDYAKVAAKARELGLNSEEGKSFLAETFKTDTKTVKNYLDSHQTAHFVPDGSSESAQQATTRTSTAQATPASLHQIALTSAQAPVVFKAVHGAGNKNLSDEDIQAWFNAKPRSPEEIVAALVSYGVSATQAGRAMGVSAARVDELLIEYGVDQQTLVAREVEGWTQEDLNRAVEGLPEEQDDLNSSQTTLAERYQGVEPLMNDARTAEDAAAEKKGDYDALNAKFEPAFAEYTNLSQELAGLEGTIQTEQGQKAAAQNTLANLGAIDKDRDRRATAERDANYQIANSDQKIADAQTRAAAVRARMQEMEVWGKPLMEQTQAAKAEWEQAAKVAVQKNEIAGAQGDMALRASDEYRAAINNLNAGHSKIITYLQANPDLQSAKEVQKSVLVSMGALETSLEEHRSWTNAAVAKGEALHQDALGLEAQTEAIKGQLDAVQPARMAAEADIALKQGSYDAAKAAEVQAQADLDAAYRQRHDANYAQGKGGRARARDEADRLIEFRAAELTTATQKRQETEAALKQAKSQGEAALIAGAETEAHWKQVAAISGNGRAQAIIQAGIANQLVDVEVATQAALAQNHLQLIGLSQAKVDAVHQMVEAGQASRTQLVAVEKEVQVDLQDSIAALHGLEQTAVSDRVAEGYVRDQYVAAQTQATGSQLIADNLVSDALGVQQVIQATDIGTLQANLAAAETRLKNAEWNAEVGDMHLDWAEGKAKPKKQSKAMGQARTELEAANTELAEARATYEVAKIQLQSAQHLTSPLLKVGSEASWAAASALSSADVASQQATTLGLQAQVARSRFGASDATFAAAQAGLIQATRTLGLVQHEVAKVVPEDAGQIIEAQAQRGLQWADDYAALVVESRQAQEESRTQGLALDQLTVEAGSTQLLGQFLQGKVERVAHAYEEAKNQLPGLEANLQARRQQAQTDIDSAKNARDSLESLEQSVAVDFALSRSKKKTVGADAMRQPAIQALLQEADPTGEKGLVAAFASEGGAALARANITPEQINARAAVLAEQENSRASTEAHANAPDFLAQWQESEMKKRKSMSKQLHLLDDMEQFKNQNADLQASRAAAMDTAKGAERSNQAAIDAGEEAQAGLLMAAIQGQWLLGAQSYSAEVATQAADLTGKLAAQAAKVEGLAEKEKTASDHMLAGLSGYASDSAAFSEAVYAQAQDTRNPATAQLLKDHAQQLGNEAQAYVPLVENAQIINEVAAQRVTDAALKTKNAEELNTTWKQVATTEQQKEAQVQTLVQGDIQQLEDKKGQLVSALTEMYGVQSVIKQTVQAYVDKADYVKEIHADRLMADQVEKKRKKKALFSLITNSLAMVGAIAMMATGVLAPEGISLGAEIALNTGVTMAFDAAAQGINLAAGWQEKFDHKTMAASASMAGFIAIAGTVSLLIDDVFKGTMLAKAVPGRPGINGLLTEGNPLTGAFKQTFPKAYVASVAPIAGGELSALGGAISWGTGAFAGATARQAFDVATGLSRNSEFSWDWVAMQIVQQAIGGAFTAATGTGQWTRQMHASFPSTVEFTPQALAISMARRFVGTGTQYLAQYALGQRDEINIADIGTLVLAQLGQVVTGAGLLPRSVVPTAAAQALIRSVNFVIQEAVIGGLLNGGFDLAIARGLGRGAIGQQSAVWGSRTISDFIKSFGTPAPAK